jgi:hypothetical protein
LAIKHVPSTAEQPCAVCGARFVAAEDSGSRVFSMQAPEQEPFRAVMCGGCYSKWSHGTSVTIQGTMPSVTRPAAQ